MTNSTLLALVSVGFFLSGMVLSVLALWRARTPQGATAWVIALISFPFLAVPAFLIFGRNKFYGYAMERKQLDRDTLKELAEAQKALAAPVSLTGVCEELSRLAQSNGQPGFTENNQVRLLLNGDETYRTMLEDITSATKYILVQFYIFRDDETGQRFKNALVAKAREGVRVYFLYDNIGTKLKAEFLRELEDAGVKIQVFRGTKKLFRAPVQINFRNHRKLLIVDGRTVFTGGLNVGDDYLGKSGPWRDTHVRIEGPATLAAQVSFEKDWYWAKGKVADLDWVIDKNQRGEPALVMSTGPADDIELCLLSHLSLVLSAKKRLWIGNPYFVPPEGFANALALAAQRGVDVRIMVPLTNDNLLVKFASAPHMEKLIAAGVKFWNYSEGFMHQKVMLVDDEMGMVGSVNLDARSFFINFEVMAVSADPSFIASLENMMKDDFAKSLAVTAESFKTLPLWRKIAGRAANLFAPMI